MSAPTSVEQIINMVLDQIGYPEYIGNVYEGTKQARIALNNYTQTRDAMLSEGDWEFAERNINGVLLKQAPNAYLVPWTSAYPAQPWSFSYAYPADALKIRSVKPTAIFVPNFDPQPWPYSVDNDSSFNPPQRVILSNVPSAIIVYTGSILDPTTWDIAFTEELIIQLSRKMAPALKQLETEQLLIPEEREDMSIAKDKQE